MKLSKSLSAGAATLGLVGASLALAAAPAAAATCASLSPITGDTTCTVGGTLGSGETVSIPVTIFGAGGGSGSYSSYVVGGRGAEVTTTLSVPAGSTLTFTQGTGGDLSGGGGGSSAITMGSVLLVEAGGGGGSSDGDNSGDRSLWGGGDAAANNTAAGGNGATSCGGLGGNSAGTGNGGAGGTIAGSCAGTDIAKAVAGSPGASAATGGAGGTGGSDSGGNGNAGSGYSAGGQVGDVDHGTGGAGGGGGYGGGGGSNASLDPISSSTSIGGAGAGGSYANPLYTSGTTYQPSSQSYGEGGDDGSGGDGALLTTGEGPIVQTAQAPASGIGKTGATVHSMANGNGSDANVSVEYSTSADFSTITGTVTSSPSSAGAATNTNVTTTLTGLTACTTYYYRVKATQIESPLASAVGEAVSFTTTCDPALPLTVKAKSASAKVKKSGTTTVVKSAKTSSKGTIKISVRCTKSAKSLRGDMRYCSYRTTPAGKVTVTTFGYSAVKVKVTIRAVPKPKYKKSYKASTWTRSWQV